MNKKSIHKLSIGNILLEARESGGVSQEYMAEELDVSKKTIGNWEKGISLPNIYQTLEWFEILDQNPYTYYYKYKLDTDCELDEVLLNAITTLPEDAKNKILFLLLGQHESSVPGVVEIITAYLHTDRRSKLLMAQQVVDAYNNCLHSDTLNCTDEIMPNIKLIEDGILDCKQIVYKKD